MNTADMETATGKSLICMWQKNRVTNLLADTTILCV